MLSRLKQLAISLIGVLALALVATTPAKAYEPRVPADFYGVSAPYLFELARVNDTVSLGRQAQSMRGAGVDWARITLDWREIEPLLGVGDTLHVYNFTATDRLVRALASQGITLLPNTYGTPFWARDLESTLAGCAGNAAVARAHATSFGDLNAAIVRRYGPNGSFWSQNPELPYLPVKQIELWNEPNWMGYWCPSPNPEQFAPVLAAAARAVRAENPNVKTVLGGLVPVKEDTRFADGSLQGISVGSFLKRATAYEPQLPQLIDSVGIHLYDPDVDSNLSLLGWLRARMADAGFGEAEILVTEFGWRTGGPEPKITEELRAQHMAALVDELPRTDCAVSGIAPHDWANLRLDPADPHQWYSIADLATGALTPTAEAYEDSIDLYRGRGETPAPRDVTPVCGALPPDQDGDGTPDEQDDYPTDPDLQEGADEPPPPPRAPEPEPRTRPALVDDAYFAMGVPFMPENPDERGKHYDEMKRIGIGAVKESVEWRDVEPAAGAAPTERYRWTDIDRRILGYAKRGIHTRIAPFNRPGWLPPTKQAADTAYAEFMSALAARYATGGDFWKENQHLDPTVAPRDFDVWTAANTAEGAWDGVPTAAGYAETYLQTRAALRQVDPNVRAIVNVHDHGPAGSAAAFIRDMVAAKPGLAGAIDGVYVLASPSTTPSSFDTKVAEVRSALRETGNASAQLYMGFGASLVGTGLNEAQRADLYAKLAGRAPRLDCGVDGVVLNSWTSRQEDPANAWDWYGTAHLLYAAAWPSAIAFADTARSFTGYGTTEAPREAISACFGEPLDRDEDGVPDAADSHPLDPTQSGSQVALPPAPAFNSTPAQWTKDTRATLAYSAQGAQSYQCALDGSAWSPCGAQFTTPTLAAGQHTMSVRAVSSLGLVGQPAAYSWNIDLTPPDTLVAAGPSGTVQTENVQFRLAASEPADKYACRLDDGAWNWCDATVNLTNLSDGLHRFRAFVIDRAGNADGSPVYREFTVRAVPDLPAITNAQNLHSSFPTFTFAAAYATRFECRFDGAAWAACANAASHTPSRPLPAGQHQFAVRGTGATGKAGPIATWSFETTEVTVADETPPTVRITRAKRVRATKRTASFTILIEDDSEVSSITCKLDTRPKRPCEGGVTFRKLKRGRHVLRVQAVDQWGNKGVAKVRWRVRR